MSSLKNGETAVIKSVNLNEKDAKRLSAIGITSGAVVRCVRRAPLGDPMEIIVRKVHVAIRLKQARNISVVRSL